MKMDDYKCAVPNELKKLAEQFQVEKCWIFPDNIWQIVVQMRKTAWKNMWGTQPQ